MRRIMGLIVVVLVWSVPAAAGRAEPDINDTRLLSQPAVSARHVAFIYADDLWVADLDGSNVRRLTSDIGIESHPVFSPDARWVVYQVDSIPAGRAGRAGRGGAAPGAETPGAGRAGRAGADAG